VVKPEQTTVHIDGGSAKLRVYVRNNFPYRLWDFQMRAEASGYQVTVDPPSADVHPAQDVSFVLSISGGAGDVASADLNIQVKFRVGDFRGGDDCLVNQQPDEGNLAARSEYMNNPGPCNFADNQSASLSAATLADRNPSATLGGGEPTFGRTGTKQLIHFFGYRFCYNTGGGWRSGGQDCPSPAAEGSAWTSTEQFGQNCMRAGVELGARKTKLGSDLQAARDAATNAVKAGSPAHMCLAAVVGGYLWQGAGNADAFKGALSASGMPQACKDAGLRALDGSNGSSCSGGSTYEQAACAAAEGLQGNAGVVSAVLMPRASDGENASADGSKSGYEGLYYSYMLYLVASHFRVTTGGVPFFPDAGGTASPLPDVAVTPPPSPDSAVQPPRNEAGVPVDGWVPPPPPPVGDGGVTPRNEGSSHGADGTGRVLDGGCAVAAPAAGGIWALALAALLFALRRRA
jgi:hypothetical protein